MSGTANEGGGSDRAVAQTPQRWAGCDREPGIEDKLRLEGSPICKLAQEPTHPEGFAATADYEAMIRNFSPRELAIMLEATKNYPTLSNRLRAYSNCQQRYRQLLALVAPEPVPATHLGLYKTHVA